MRFFPALKIGAMGAAICLCMSGQTTPGKDAHAESKGKPPRATAADYQAHGQAGALTVAGEFSGHWVPVEPGPLSTEDYVVVEVGLFGAPGARIRLSAEDFSLRLNGRKTALPSRQASLLFASLKDPDWVPPEAAESKSSKGGGLNVGGDQSRSNEPPPPVKVPFELKRAMTQRVEKAALPEGDRPLPVAGLLFFQWSGNDKGIHSVQLIYDGPAGKATLERHP
jgi:hypothetical protein